MLFIFFENKLEIDTQSMELKNKIIGYDSKKIFKGNYSCTYNLMPGTYYIKLENLDKKANNCTLSVSASDLYRNTDNHSILDLHYNKGLDGVISVNDSLRLNNLSNAVIGKDITLNEENFDLCLKKLGLATNHEEFEAYSVYIWNPLLCECVSQIADALKLNYYELFKENIKKDQILHNTMKIVDGCVEIITKVADKAVTNIIAKTCIEIIDVARSIFEFLFSDSAVYYDIDYVNFLDNIMKATDDTNIREALNNNSILDTRSYSPNMSKVFKLSVYGKISNNDNAKISFRIKYENDIENAETQFYHDALSNPNIDLANKFSTKSTYSIYDIYEYNKTQFDDTGVIDKLPYLKNEIIQIDKINGVDHPSFTIDDAECKWFKFIPKESKEYYFIAYGETKSDIEINIFNKYNYSYLNEGLLFTGKELLKLTNNQNIAGCIALFKLNAGEEYFIRVNGKGFNKIQDYIYTNRLSSLLFEVYDYWNSSRVHTCVYDRYKWLDYTSHKEECRCGKYGVTLKHIVSSRGLKATAMPQYKECLSCHGPAKIGFIINDLDERLNVKQIINIRAYTKNGSCVLNDGIVILDDKDVDLYKNGKLIFVENCSSQLSLC